MKNALPSIESANVRGKKVFVRCDFDVLLEGATSNQQLAISDDVRLVSGISTIEYLLENGATVIAAGHLGRPGGQFSISNFQFSNVDKKFSLEPVAKWFSEEFPGSNIEETSLGDFKAWKIKESFYVLENLRFYTEEEDPTTPSGQEFVRKLASLAEIYVNEAFGSSHRSHASIVGVPSLIPHFAGFHLQKEIKILSNIIENPKKPFTFIVGGAKIETKLPLVSKMHRFADYVLVGGEIAVQDKVLIKEQHEEILGHKAMLIVADTNSEKTDITQKSLENFLQIVSRSGCIVWNGPMGFLEKGFGDSTLNLAKGILDSSAYKVVGGGDTIAFLNKHGLLEKFDFASTGGGAMLEFFSGQSLPGILALQN